MKANQEISDAVTELVGHAMGILSDLPPDAVVEEFTFRDYVDIYSRSVTLRLGKDTNLELRLQTRRAKS